ncbi:MAG: hypothetical protein R2752_20840 [Vicinamibacterales bacterium]
MNRHPAPLAVRLGRALAARIVRAFPRSLAGDDASIRAFADDAVADQLARGALAGRRAR